MKITGNKQDILNTPLPNHSGRYGIIPHALFLETLQNKVNEAGFRVKNEIYYTNHNNSVVSGVFTLSGYGDVDIDPSIYFVNSYDKSKKASIDLGGTVLVCTNGMVSHYGYSRKHIGENAYSDFVLQIVNGIEKLDKSFQELIVQKEEMKNIKINKDTISKLIGDMYLEQNLIKSEQLSILKQELKHSKHFKDDSVWSFYNNVTESFKHNSSKNYNKQHLKFHSYVADNFNLPFHRGLYKSIL